MAVTLIRGGAEIEHVTPGELRAELDAAARRRYRAIKYMRMPVLSGTPSGGALTMGGASSPDVIGPAQGYAWVLRHLWSSGLTTGTNPDELNILVNSQTWWQLNGNNFAYTWEKATLVLLGGEAIQAQSTGTFNATGRISVGGAVFEGPAERLAELY